MTSPAFIAHQFVVTIDRRDWDALRGLLAPDCHVEFVHDGRRFSGEGWVEFNSSYPGRWSFVAEDIVATDARAVLRARVFDDATTFHVASFLTVVDGQITEITEVWTDGHACATEE